MAIVKDITGKKFGRLTAISRGVSTRHGRATWNCLCDCGASIIVDGGNLTTGNTSSCGCLWREAMKVCNTVHGKTKTKEYRVWSGMMTRCYNTNRHNFKNYGGRGIRVCERWHEFSNFLADMGECPSGLTLDRLDNDGDYEPSNCRWASMFEQVANKRTTHRVLCLDRALTVTEWARERQMPLASLLRRLAIGESPCQALGFAGIKRRASRRYSLTTQGASL